MAEVDDITARLKERVPGLGGRAWGAAEFGALTATGQLPQVTPAAHVIPTGIKAGPTAPRTGAYVQSIDRLYSVVLTVKAGDASGARALPVIGSLIDAIIVALAGWDWGGRVGVMTFRGYTLARAVGGAFVYDISFSITDQLRIIPT
ncbi:phage tail terminator protein [Rhodobacter capsulatus]|uniref:phage tail terminator protein n=1 Tax=Rhodobacter capsulatus TaxID=1061 RepID=UPI0003D2F5D4|nr:hypothetical protein [Rhodobacter capsulatus]ETD86710.1 hypothetical protein U716_02580 [Rhodobacter capsulatus B6]